MQVKTLLPIVFAFLLVLPLVSADYTCQPIDISIVVSPLQVYPYNQPFTISADITNNPSGNPVNGQIIDSTGRVLQEVLGSKNPLVNTWGFTFSGVDVGDYTIKIYLTHPASQQVVSKTLTFSIKTPLAVIFSINNQIQYIGTDIISTFTVSPSSVSMNKALRATVDGIDVPVSPSYIDKGGGLWEIKIPSGQLINEGTLNLYLTLSDVSGKYNQVARSIEGITLTKAQLVVRITIPTTATTGQSFQIKINLQGIGGQAVDVDKNSDLNLEITLPSGAKENYGGDKFIHSGTGEYVMSYTPLMPQQYYLRVSAFKSNYGSGSQSTNIAVTGTKSSCGNNQCESGLGENEITCPSDCQVGYCGDGLCGSGETSSNCSSDCGGFPWWIVIVVLIVIAIVVIYFAFVKK